MCVYSHLQTFWNPRNQHCIHKRLECPACAAVCCSDIVSIWVTGTPPVKSAAYIHLNVFCSVLQSVAMCCSGIVSTRQGNTAHNIYSSIYICIYVAARCSVLQCVAVILCCVLQRYQYMLQCVAVTITGISRERSTVCCSVLQWYCVVCCSVLQWYCVVRCSDINICCSVLQWQSLEYRAKDLQFKKQLHIHIYIYIYTYIHVHIYQCLFIFTHIHTHECLEYLLQTFWNPINQRCIHKFV